MNPTRALVVFFTGSGEPTPASIRNIINTLRADDKVNAQSVTVHVLDSSDLAKIAVSATQIPDDVIQVNTISPLDEAFMRIHNYYGDKCKIHRGTPIVEMTRDFLANDPIHEAFIVIHNASDEDISVNKAYNTGQVSREFISALKRIVESLN